jgi:K+-sensing histidine kinase KdpD
MRLSYVTSHALRYFLAVLLVAVVTAAFFTMREALETSIIALLYLLPVVLITVLWGLRPGITTAALAFFAFNY